MPEFLNRISSTVIFNRLSKSEIRKIVDVRLAEIQKRLEKNDKHVKIDCSLEVRDWLGTAGYTPQYGARPLGRLIEKEILNKMAVYILNGSIKEGEVARIVMDNGKITILPNHQGMDNGVDSDDDEMDIDYRGDQQDDDEDVGLYDD